MELKALKNLSCKLGAHRFRGMRGAGSLCTTDPSGATSGTVLASVVGILAVKLLVPSGPWFCASLLPWPDLMVADPNVLGTPRV